MKVNHKTFTGGYRFGLFEGQANGPVTLLDSSPDDNPVVMSLSEGNPVYQLFTSMGRLNFDGPKTSKLSLEGALKAKDVKTIIVSAIQVEPYDLKNEILVNEASINRFMDGLKAIRDAFSQAKILLTATSAQESLLHLFQPLADNHSFLEVVSVEPKYPINMKELLIPTLTGKTYPVGYRETHLGMLVLDVVDVLLAEQINQSVNKPLHTFVALSGPGFKENQIVEVPIGTKIDSFLKRISLADGELRLIKNSAIRGELIDPNSRIDGSLRQIVALPEDRHRQTMFFMRGGKDADSFTNAFLSALMPKAIKKADTNIHGERRACVNCTYCQQVCPVGIIPHLLHKYVNKELYQERVAELGIYNCIDCKLCDYVCPSKIHVAADINKGKEALEAIEISHNDYLLPECDMIQNEKGAVQHG